MSRPPDDQFYTFDSSPRHHAIEETAQPKFRQLGLFGGFAAASEGWGLYAERLAIENGWYDDDPIGRLGALDSELFRARRLVVDTGLHAKGWTREQAQAYFREHVPSQSLAEVDRYIARPGQALAYKIGELRIRALRTRAEQALGPRFDVRAFHDVILRNGSLPLDMLDEQVAAYIEQVRP